MPEYKRFDEGLWAKFGKPLLLDKRASAEQKAKQKTEQKEFLGVCRSGKSAFMEYIHGKFLSCENSVIVGDPIALKYKFTEREFLHPPKDTQQKIWDTFKDIPDEQTTSCGFWGCVIIDMIKDNCLEPCYLASNLNGVRETGIHVIDLAIKSDDEHTINKCTRRILRSMCNPEARGKRIIFNDFYLGKAYWRWRWAYNMSQHIALDFEQILQILSEDYYASFSEKMHSGKSYISSENTLGGLLLFLDQETMPGDTLEEVIDRLSYLSAWKALEMQEPQDNQKEIQEIAKIVERFTKKTGKK